MFTCVSFVMVVCCLVHWPPSWIGSHLGMAATLNSFLSEELVINELPYWVGTEALLIMLIMQIMMSSKLSYHLWHDYDLNNSWLLLFSYAALIMQFCNLYIRFILNSYLSRWLIHSVYDPDEGNMASNEQEG